MRKKRMDLGASFRYSAGMDTNISLINRATHGPKLALGKIKIGDVTTTFDIAKSGAAKMAKVLSQFKYYDKPVFADVVQ